MPNVISINLEPICWIIFPYRQIPHSGPIMKGFLNRYTYVHPCEPPAPETRLTSNLTKYFEKSVI